MGIDASLESEKTHSLATVSDARSLFAWGLRLGDHDSTACLRFIDPYADTVFNQAQLPVLLVELQAARQAVTNQQLESAKKEYLERAKTWGGPPETMTEVREYVDWLSLDGIQGQFDKIIDMIRDAINLGPHVYVRFIGD